MKKVVLALDDVLEFNSKPICGLRFCIIGIVIIFATILGGDSSMKTSL